MGRVLFITRSLAGGGAERQLCVLACALKELGHQVTVATFYPGGPYAASMLAGSGVSHVSLDKRGTSETVAFLLRAVRLVRELRPDVIHGYLDLGNALAAALRPWAPRARIVLGLRNADLGSRHTDALGRVAVRVARLGARVAHAYIANSRAAAAHHIALGYVERRMHVVYNGIDVRYFDRDPVGRASLRQALRLGPDDRLIAIIGRLDPRKGLDTFVAAAHRLSADRADARFLCVGDGEGEQRSSAESILEESGLGERLTRIGFQRNMAAVYSACDIVTCASRTESFPNVLAEAMACGVPCVTTDVGDAAHIVGSLGLVVPVDAPREMARAWLATLERVSVEVGAACRARIVAEFDVARLAAETSRILGLPSAESSADDVSADEAHS